LIPVVTLSLESIPPRWQNQGQNSTHTSQGGAINLYSQGFDNETGLRYAWLETNETGQWQNKSIYYLNALNDSSTIKNITFTGKENKTIWIRLPKNSNVLSATAKLKGYPFPNTTIRTGDDTEDWFGYYLTGGTGILNYSERAHDQNWGSFAECTNTTNWFSTVYCHIMENYTRPSYAKGAQIFVEGACPRACMMGPWYTYCWNWTSNNSWITVGSSTAWGNYNGSVIPGNISANVTPENLWDCFGPEMRIRTVVYDNIGNDTYYKPTNGTYWEAMVNWLNESYTSNPYINVGEDTPTNFTDDDTEDWFGYYLTGGTGILNYSERAHDQNWGSFAECTNTTNWFSTVYCHIMENYTRPSYAKGANVTVQAACPRACMMGPWYSYCLNWSNPTNNSWITIGSRNGYFFNESIRPENISVNITPESFPECLGSEIRIRTQIYDNIGNDTYYKPSNGTYWESKVRWYNHLNLDSDYEWQYSGDYSGIQTTSDFSKEINDYLLYCLPDSQGYCNVSLMIHSDTAGRIEVSDLNISYISGDYLKMFYNIKDKWTLANFTWQNSSVPSGTIVGWRIHYQDGDVNRNATNIMTFKVKIPSNCSLTGLTNHTYEITDNPICTCTGDGTTHLHLNGTLRDDMNNTNALLGAWNSNWVCNITEGTNYAYATTSIYQTISKATSPLILANNASWTANYPTATNITGEGCPLQLGCALYRDNSPINIRNVFNNASQYIWNESFNGLDNRTFWVNLPKNDYIRSVKMSLTGLYMPSNTTLTKSTTGDRSMWMEYDGTYLWTSGNYNGRTYKHKPDEAPSTYYNFAGPIVYDGTYLWTQNWNGGNITKRDYSNPNTILGQFMPPDNCYGNISRGMTWGITYMGPQGSPSTNVGNHLIYYCDVNNTTAEPIYWLNETKGLEQGYCNSTNSCILKTCGPGYNIINDLTFDKATNRLYGAFDLNPGDVGIFKIVVDNTQGYCPGGPGYSNIYPENISTNSGLALKRTDLVWYGTGNLIDTDSEFEKYYLINLYDTYPSNIFIDVANDGDIQWNYTGTLSSKVQTSELGVDAISYLSSCTPKIDGTCDVPFVLHADAQGIVQLSEILMINNTMTDSKLFGPGSYIYKFNTSGNENYTAASITNTLTIDKGNANVVVYPGNQSIKYGTSISQYCVDNVSDLDCKIYRNDSEIINNTNEVLLVGIYGYKANITNTVNYTNYQSISTLTVANCTSDADCDDSIECTNDICNNPGTVNSYCSHSNKPSGTLCGLARDCPTDTCNGFKAEFYPDDGHDTCDGSSNCVQYSCSMQNSYCTDNNPLDGINTLECGAGCDQDSDCSDMCVGNTSYKERTCDLLSTCACSQGTSEDCNLQTGCYAYDTGCENREYYCTLGNCDYTYSGRNTDYNDDFVNYCSADELRKHRQSHDFYCEGTCLDHMTWVDDELVEDCNLQDGWYNTTNNQWVNATQCTEKEQLQQEYRDYTCSAASCTYTIINNRWIDTGSTRNKNNGVSCDDGLYCTEPDVCTDGVCGGSQRDCSDAFSCTDDSCDEINDICLNTINDNKCTSPEVCRPSFFPPPTGCGVITACTNKTDGTPCDDEIYCNGADECYNWTCVNVGPPIECSANDLSGIETCDNIPDDYHFTWDFRNPFTSVCLEVNDTCTIGDNIISHTCSVVNCSADCDSTHSCDDKCVGSFRYYSGSCNLESCDCSYSTEDCNLQDGWYNTTNNQWINDTQCTEKEQIHQEYKDYTCLNAQCTFTITDTRWIDTGSTRNKNNGVSCDDGLYCTEPDVCTDGVCGGSQRDCSSNNISGISTCFNNPDNINFTRDFRNPFVSMCNETIDLCTSGDSTITHTCNKTLCSAQCERDSDCSIGICKADCTCGIWESIYMGSGGYPIIDIEEHNGKLYFASNNNNIYAFNGSSWSTIQTPVTVSTIRSFNNKLYVAGGPGEIYRYDEPAWTKMFSIDEPMTVEYLKMLGVYNGRLYAGSYLDKPAMLYYSTDGVTWIEDTGFSSILYCPSYVCSIDSMEVYNGKMYISGSSGKIYEYDGSNWIVKQTYNDVYSFNDMKVFNNKLYFATRDQNIRCPMYAGGSGFCGRVIEYNGTNWNTKFDNIGSNGYWMYSLESYNGRLYAGTANRIYMSSDANNWELTYNSTSGAEYALVMKNWSYKIYVGFGNGLIAKDDMLEPLNLKLLSPANTTYTTSSVPLTFTINRPVSWIGYSLDGKPNVTIKTNTTLSALTNGGHNIILYASEAIGKTSTSKVYFTVSVPTQTCTCTNWLLDDTGCCRTRICTPKGCALEKSCNKICIL